MGSPWVSEGALGFPRGTHGSPGSLNGPPWGTLRSLGVHRSPLGGVLGGPLRGDRDPQGSPVLKFTIVKIHDCESSRL